MLYVCLNVMQVTVVLRIRGKIMTDAMVNHIEELTEKDKQIEFLKEDKEKLKQEFIDNCNLLEKRLEEKDKQLSEAKEIIRKFLQWANEDRPILKFQDIVNIAEQFIGEEK